MILYPSQRLYNDHRREIEKVAEWISGESRRYHSLYLQGRGGTTTSGHETTLKDKATYFKMADGSHLKAEANERL